MPQPLALFFSLQELPSVAQSLCAHANGVKVWSFQGDMGAGKTTLIRAICAHLGVVDNVHSPTFTLVNTYLTKQGSPVYHFDFYRLAVGDARWDTGIDVAHYFASGCYCFIEWPSRCPLPLPTHYEVALQYRSRTVRGITASIKPAG